VLEPLTIAQGNHFLLPPSDGFFRCFQIALRLPRVGRSNRGRVFIPTSLLFATCAKRGRNKGKEKPPFRTALKSNCWSVLGHGTDGVLDAVLAGSELDHDGPVLGFKMRPERFCPKLCQAGDALECFEAYLGSILTTLHTQV